MIGTRPFGTVLLASILVGVGALLLASQAQAHSPMPAAAPAGVKVQGKVANLHQRRMIARVLHQCDHMGVSRKALIASVITITQESWATNLNWGHSSSLGLFQILDMHGSASQRLNPEWSARWHCSRSKNVDHHRPRLTAAQLAQAVQRSGKRCRLGPGRPTPTKCYQRWTREGVRTYRLTLRRP